MNAPFFVRQDMVPERPAPVKTTGFIGFLRTRLLTHVFGRPADDRQTADTIKYACEHLQTERATGTPAAASALVADFHRRVAEALAD